MDPHPLDPRHHPGRLAAAALAVLAAASCGSPAAAATDPDAPPRQALERAVEVVPPGDYAPFVTGCVGAVRVVITQNDGHTARSIAAVADPTCAVRP